jgi:hypothetical protein
MLPISLERFGFIAALFFAVAACNTPVKEKKNASTKCYL